jgi:arsenate reductase (thioredoxin)
MKILILCTGNSCRSQMAEGFLKSFDSSLEVSSAGTHPAFRVSSKAVKVMKEVGVDISKHYPKSVNEFLNTEWDYVITVCDKASETCPAFFGKVKNRMHIGFEDPAAAKGTDDEIMEIYRRIRDEIKTSLFSFYKENIMKVNEK